MHRQGGSFVFNCPSYDSQIKPPAIAHWEVGAATRVCAGPFLTGSSSVRDGSLCLASASWPSGTPLLHLSTPSITKLVLGVLEFACFLRVQVPCGGANRLNVFLELCLIGQTSAISSARAASSRLKRRAGLIRYVDLSIAPHTWLPLLPKIRV